MGDGLLPLQFVPLDTIVPHEEVDDRRASRLAEDLVRDGVMRNPPLVALDGETHILLDGATRAEALRRLGSAHAIVQEVTDPADALLETWHHVVTGVEPRRLLDAMAATERVRLDPVTGDGQTHAVECGGLCSVVTADGRAFVAFPEPGVNRFDALGAFAHAYQGAGVVSRTLETDLDILLATYPRMAALVEFPQFTVEQVLVAASVGSLLPAGVTRFIVPGRVLRLDIALELLLANSPLADKNRWLRGHLAEKARLGRIRYYREPVYLLDE